MSVKCCCGETRTYFSPKKSSQLWSIEGKSTSKRLNEWHTFPYFEWCAGIAFIMLGGLFGVHLDVENKKFKRKGKRGW